MCKKKNEQYTSTDCLCYHCENPLCLLPHCESYNDEYCRWNLENKSECVKKYCEYYLGNEDYLGDDKDE